MNTVADLKVDINLATANLERQSKVANSRIEGIGKSANNASRNLERMANTGVNKSLGGLGNRAAQVSYQLQDIAVQAQNGTSAFVIMSQQGSQLAAAFGPGGAVFGAVIALSSAIGGALVSSLFNAGNEAEQLREKIEGSLGKSLRVQIRETKQDIKDQASVIQQIRDNLSDFDNLPAPQTSVRGKNRQKALEKALEKRAAARLVIATELADAEENLIRLKERQLDLQDRLDKKNNPDEGGDNGKKSKNVNYLPDTISPVESIRRSMLTVEQAEIESHARRIEQIQAFMDQNTELRAYGMQIIEAENERHEQALIAIKQKSVDEQTKIEERKHQVLQTMQANTINMAMSLASALAGNSKKAAKAVIAIETGLNIARTIQNTAAASMRAMAELGPIAGPPAVAGIQTMGKIQLGLIAAAGALKFSQAGGSSGGGSFSSISSGTGQAGAAPIIPTTPQERPINIVIQKDAQGGYSLVEQVDELRDYLEDSDYVLITDTSRNGQVLRNG